MRCAGATWQGQPEYARLFQELPQRGARLRFWPRGSNLPIACLTATSVCQSVGTSVGGRTAWSVECLVLSCRVARRSCRSGLACRRCRAAASGGAGGVATYLLYAFVAFWARLCLGSTAPRFDSERPASAARRGAERVRIIPANP